MVQQLATQESAIRPILHLSGPKLTAMLEILVQASSDIGGIERFAEALKLKSQLFQEFLLNKGIDALEQSEFIQLCAFIPTCRRRIGQPLADLGYAHFQSAIKSLLDAANNGTEPDRIIGNLVDSFPDGKNYRWVRDFGADILHFCDAEKFPLMTKWVWDAQANTGVLREIWHGDNVDYQIIDIPDGYETFLVLREELSQFLSDQGVFKDMIYYIDLLKAQIYADYINSQGGTYLRADFSNEADPLEHVRRLLGLDGIKHSGLIKFKSIDGRAIVIEPQRYLS